jgi:pimeloyl-ACP methyl ester carboxylesterase
VRTIEAIRHWAEETAGREGNHAGDLPLPSNRARLRAFPEPLRDGLLLRERCGYLPGGMFALHAAPATGARGTDRPLVLMLNSGANHQVGPNRLYVTLARLLAARGYESLRIDLPGLGETPARAGDEENLPYMPDPVVPLRRLAGEPALQGRPLILLGLCSGAYHAFLSAIELRNADVREVVLINPLTFYWEQGMTLEDAPSVAYGEWNWYQQSARDLDRWKRLLTGQINPLPILGSLGSRMMQKIRTQAGRIAERLERSPEDRISPSLRNSLLKIERRGVKLTLLFADTDPGLGILRDRAQSTLKAMVARGSAEMQRISGADHTFSRLRPRKALLEWIDRHFRS